MRGLMSVIIVILSLSPFAALGASLSPMSLEQGTLIGTNSSGAFHHYPDAPDEAAAAILQDLRDADKSRSPALVIGSDERTQVTQTDVFPYSAIAFLEAGNDDEDIASHCTATFVGPTVLLTAAHCLFIPEMGGWTDYLLVLPGWNGEEMPFGYEYGINAWVPQGWIDANGDINDGYQYDYGLVTLETGVLSASTGEMTVGVLSTEALQDANFNATTAGYPGDKPLGTQWAGTQASFLSVDDQLLIHEIDSFKGQSGSAVWRGSDMAIVGVESFETTEINGARRINQSVMNEFLGACQQLACSINYFIDGQTGPPNQGPEPGPSPSDRPTGPAEPIPGCQYFTETQHNLCEPFLSYWHNNGGLPVFGFPTSEPFDEMNPDLGEVFLTQYFERERMEHHPDNAGTPYEILLGRLGHEVLLLQGRDWNTFPKADPSSEHYYAQTGHAIAPEFWEYWSNHGLEFGDDGVTDQESLALFGLPLSEPSMETNSSGDTVLTQWFERARFEHHPDRDPGLQVKLGLLGNEFLVLDSAPAPEPPPGENCDPSYPTICVPPPPPDLSCDDIEETNFPVVPPDSHGFDQDGDGIGCETSDPEPPTDGVPAEGDVIGSADLSTWEPVESPAGDYGEPTADGYAITNLPNSALQLVADGDFGDASYSIRTRVLQTAPAGFSCLSVRMTFNPQNPNAINSSYDLCLVFGPVEDGGAPVIFALTASYVSFATATPEIVDLGVFPLAEPVSASDWHEVKIIAQGNSFWFLLDGQLLGSAEHGGPTSGALGFWAANITTVPEPGTAQAHIIDAIGNSAFADRLPLGIPAGASQVEFADLTVRALQ